MGYTTEFDGMFTLDQPLTGEQAETLRHFSDTRHDDRAMPSHYCQWVPTKDGAGIEWDGNEKFYAYTEWLAVIIDRFLVPWGRTLNGSVTWQGEKVGDVGFLVVEDNKVRTIDIPAAASALDSCNRARRAAAEECERLRAAIKTARRSLETLIDYFDAMDGEEDSANLSADLTSIDEHLRAALKETP